MDFHPIVDPIILDDISGVITGCAGLWPNNRPRVFLLRKLPTTEEQTHLAQELGRIGKSWKYTVSFGAPSRVTVYAYFPPLGNLYED